MSDFSVISMGIDKQEGFCISVAKDAPFRRRFLDMAAVSLGVAGLGFILGCLIRSLLGAE